MSVFDIIYRHSTELTQGLCVTLALCGISWSVSFILGSILGVLAARFSFWIGIPVRTASILMSGVPAIVFLFWLHYPAQALLGIVVDPFITAATAVSILGVLMVSDAMRTVLKTFPKQYETAGKVCGLNERQILIHIKIPILFRHLLPTFILIAVTLFQMTLFASFISVDEVFRVAQRINSVTYKPIEVFSALAVFCIAVCLPLNLFAQYLSHRFTRDDSEQ